MLALRRTVRPLVPSRRCFLQNAAGAVAKKKIVFMGTPEVAAKTLEIFTAAVASEPHSYLDIIAVVSQPPSAAGRHRKIINSPVHDLANAKGIPVLCPESAKDEAFLTAMEQLAPDLCITAAYGNYLPKRFLAIPKHGTINIHPSLLPKYRGAAPVQRCLEAGDSAAGVSVLLTVTKMDAGPILRQLPYPLTGNEQAPEVLDKCIAMGARALLEALPEVFAGTARYVAQLDADATHADKLTTADGLIDFSQETASVIHNKCRGYADWPGIHAFFLLGRDTAPTRVKILTTALPSIEDLKAQKIDLNAPIGVTQPCKALGMLLVRCAEDSFLGITEMQMATKHKSVKAKAYMNGYKELVWTDPPAVDKAGSD